MKHVLILGNQLFPLEQSIIEKGDVIFIAEDYDLCTHFKYHKQKIIFFLSAMRHYKETLADRGASVHYEKLEDKKKSESFEDKLKKFINKYSVKTLHTYSIEDKFFEETIRNFCLKNKVTLEEHPNPMFMMSRDECQERISSQKKPFMKTFYERYRQDTGILMEEGGGPIGGKFSFDAENRKKLPKDFTINTPSIPSIDEITEEVITLTKNLFHDHPGKADGFWLPVTRKDAQAWLEEFFTLRFSVFGDYEDAISQKHPFIAHSAISPLLNIGLLTPKEVIESALDFFQRDNAPINSVEGFVRQIIGWREFIRGIYQIYSEEQDQSNFWDHSRTLNSCWYDATTGIPVVDDCIQKALDYGYNHHIERLMILSNLMLLLEVKPQEVHRWFMEMYVDSSDWVMGPNVYGMGQYSDGGIFSTKPYTCGSNYIKKMTSEYKTGPWCDVFDGLYWKFIDNHRDFYRKNPRMSVMVGTLDKMKDDKKERIYKAAAEFQERVTS